MPRQSDLLNNLFTQVKREGAGRVARGEQETKGEVIRSLFMPKQSLLEKDRSRRIVTRSARRAGKSTGHLYVVTVRCLEGAGQRWVVICLTRTSSALRDYWTSLRVLNDAFELGIRFNNVAMRATFKNGSTITFVGADSVAEIEKLRGSQYDGVVIDECKSFDPHVFQELIDEVLEPALMDRNGTLYLAGTPGDLLSGPFYLASSEEEIQYDAPDGSQRRWNRKYGQPDGPLPFLWSLHEWTLEDNTTQFKDKRSGRFYTLWDKALEVKAAHGWTNDNPVWRREYLGHWVAADNRYVYRYQPHKHDYDVLPGKAEDWHRVVGVDLGTRDGTAIVVWAYSKTLPGLWELYSEKRTAEAGQKMSVKVVAEWFREVDAEFGPFEAGVCDYAGLATMVLDTLADEYQIYLDPAEKREKPDHIRLFNTDLDTGLIHIRRDSALAGELPGNRWDQKKLATGKWEEDRNTPNDVCDAALYAFRLSNHRRARPAAPSGPPLLTAAWWVEQAKRDLAEAEASVRRTSNADPLRMDSKDWWGDDD